MKYMTKEWYDYIQVSPRLPFDSSLQKNGDVIGAYWSEYKKLFPSPPDFMKTIDRLHDFSVLSAGFIGNDYVIHLEDDDNELDGNKIILKNAVVKKQDFHEQYIGWCYHELYPTEKGYELHVLFFEYGSREMYDLIVECENVEITNDKNEP